MAAYLLQTRREDGRWTMSSLRPPLEESTLMCTVISGYYLDRFATDAQRTEATLALDRAGHWLTEAARVSQEDFNARLWGTALWRSGEQADAIAAVRRDVLERQHADGGWSQLPELASDAYATGQTLFVLEASGFSTSSVEYVRGVRFLLDTRQPDGSWLVKTRSKPIQKFFDNGDPHGEHQFISTPATAWAVVALALAHRPGTEAAVKTPGSSVDRLPGERPPAIR
jgi:N-acyl-D-amino-acid deacylase